MNAKKGIVRYAAVAVMLTACAVFAKHTVWDRVARLGELRVELEEYKRLYAVKEANLINAGANARLLSTVNNGVLTNMGEAVFAALGVGALGREHGLTEVDFGTDRIVSWTSSASLVQTKVSCAFIGKYASVMDFLKDLRNADYYYRFESVRLNSAGLERGQVSVRIEVSLFSIQSTDKAEPQGISRDYFKGYDYENPFFYN